MWVYTHLKEEDMAPLAKKQRSCRQFTGATYFKPRGIPLSSLEITSLALDELEAIHLCYYEDMSQVEAAEKMKISSSTLQRLLYSGRKKIIDALYSSKVIKISKPKRVSEYVEPEGRCYGRNRGRGKCFKK